MAARRPRRPRWTTFVLAPIAAALFAGAPAGAGDPLAGTSGRHDPSFSARGSAFPGAAWESVDPAAAGLDPAPLAALPARLAGSDTDCVVVLKHGRVVFEHTWDGWDPDRDQVIWSISKSVTGVLVGIAADEGRLRVDRPVADVVPEWRGTPSAAVTVEQLLSMTSGRFSDHPTDFGTLPSHRGDQTALSLALPQEHPPGTHWAYSNSAVQVLDAVLERATGRPTADYADERLFGPLGVTASWLRDGAGHPWTYGGAQASCREIARLGLLMAAGGRWGDRQVVSKTWVRRSVRPSQALRPDYGWLWWVNTPGVVEGEGDRRRSTHLAAVPDDAFFARGLKGQYLAVLPRQHLVVVRTGRDPEDRGRWPDTGDVLAELLRAVVAADGGPG